MKSKLWLVALACCWAGMIQAADTAPVLAAKIFARQMVLQRETPFPVWGRGQPGKTYAVALAGQTREAVADAKGRWRVDLPALKAGGPFAMTVTGPEGQQVIDDILIGDVWVCSGQSNMEWGMKNTTRAAEDLPASTNPMLRHGLVPRKIRFAPFGGDGLQDDFSASWSAATPETTPHWTAVGYYFGRDLQKRLNVPIGLINASWGGTRIEAWTSFEVMSAFPGAGADLKALSVAGVGLDKLLAAYNEAQKVHAAARAKLEELENDEAQQAKFSAVGFDDKAWPEINTPGDWQSQGYPKLQGEVWYRKTVEIPAAWAGKELEFSPGAADEIERSYFNGRLIGKSGSLRPFDTSTWNVQRSYRIPGAEVKAGPATLAVRVTNLIGEGGLRSNGDPSFMYLKPAGGGKDDVIYLAGKWRFGVGMAMPVLPIDPRNPNTATVLYNGMIEPLLPLPIKGAIWYQGESNAGNAYEYRERFPAMIKDWRARWKNEFPFLWVQLANFQAPKAVPAVDSWAVVRESQDKALALPKTADASAIDVGDAKDIHPRDKATVGQRLALAARAVAYGEKNLVYSGPRYRSMTKEGDRIRVAFDHVGGGLVARGGELKRFAVAGEDGKFVWAQAKIDGGTVLVWSDEVKQPQAVRYAFEINPEGCNLYNREGLPASPFRTDAWKVPTQND